MYRLIRSILWQFPPETAHHFALSLLDFCPAFLFPKPIGQPVQVMGLTFPHALGLAAGFDCDGVYLSALAKLGFAFIEVDGVTPRAQSGQIKPRLFRLPKAHALINRMGFCNQGVEALVKRVQASNYQGILGVNIAKNKSTPLEMAVHDYIFCMQKVYPIASYITINISSPNMPHLRDLQKTDYFRTLMSQLREEQLALADRDGHYVPLAVKLSPDESDESLKRMADVLVSLGIDSIVATNTTISREEVSHVAHGLEEGGLSGRPLAERSTACLRLLKTVVGDAMTLIAVGGVDSPERAREKLDAGASLLQVYSGLVYEGPALISRILQELRRV